MKMAIGYCSSSALPLVGITGNLLLLFKKWREGSVTSVTTKIFGLVILKRGVVPKIHPSMPSLNCPS